jgi:hypothetical protein
VRHSPRRRRAFALEGLAAASAVAESKRVAWLIDGKNGDLLAEFCAPRGASGNWEASDHGLCSYRGGKFPRPALPAQGMTCKVRHVSESKDGNGIDVASACREKTRDGTIQTGTCNHILAIMGRGFLAIETIYDECD